MVAFTTYNLLTYAAEIEPGKGDTSWASESRSPARIIVLFLVDLLMLGQQGWMYAVLVLRDFSDLGQMDSLRSLRTSDVHFILLAGFTRWRADCDDALEVRCSGRGRTPAPETAAEAPGQTASRSRRGAAGLPGAPAAAQSSSRSGAPHASGEGAGPQAREAAAAADHAAGTPDADSASIR